MSIKSVVSPILITALQSFTRLQTALNTYVALGPFTRLAVKHADGLNQLQEVTLPSHIKTISKLFHQYRVQPPLNTSIFQGSAMGLLVHLPVPEEYSEGALRGLVAKCAEQLNDGIRELNENELEEKELRTWLVQSRNDFESILPIFEQKNQQGIVGKAIDWIF